MPPIELAFEGQWKQIKPGEKRELGNQTFVIGQLSGGILLKNGNELEMINPGQRRTIKDNENNSILLIGV